MEKNFYLNIGRASEIADSKDRRFYRFLEILPALLSWGTIFLVIFLSWIQPFLIAIFIIFFDVYWLLKTIFLSLHMRSAFNKMKKNLKKNWQNELETLGIGWRNIHHLVILPMYQEPLEVVRASFFSPAKINYPLDLLIAA